MAPLPFSFKNKENIHIPMISKIFHKTKTKTIYFQMIFRFFHLAIHIPMVFHVFGVLGSLGKQISKGRD